MNKTARSILLVLGFGSLAVAFMLNGAGSIKVALLVNGTAFGFFISGIIGTIFKED